MKYFACAFALVAYVAGALVIPTTIFAETSTIETVWSVDVDQRLPNSPIALSQPAVVSHGDETWLVLAGRDGWVHVYNAVSGSEERRFLLGSPSDSGALALSNGTVILGDIHGHLYAVDPDKEEIIWQKSLTAAFTASPIAIDNDFIIQTADNELYRFAANGEKRWSYTGLKNTLSLYLGAKPVVQGEYIYAVLNNGDAVKIKAYTGDLLWKTQTMAGAASILLSLQAPLAQPLLVSGVRLAGEQVNNGLLVPIFQGEMAVLSAEDGSQSFSLPVSLKSSPLLVGDDMYMAESTGYLHMYNTQSGKRIWSHKISSHALMGPVLFDGSLWLTDNQGSVFRINMNGEIEDTIQLAGSIAREPLLTQEGLIIRTDRGVMALVK